MKLLVPNICILILLANVTQGQDTALPVGSPVAREIGPGESHNYSIRANVGDLVTGVFDLRGVAGALEVRDATNTKLKTFVAYEPQPSQELRVGFLASESGTYRIHVTTSGTAKGSYVLRMESVEASKRMLGVPKEPKDVYPSERLRQLALDVQTGENDAVERFWREVEGKGPLVEPLTGADEDVLVTFLWKAVFETRNVLVVWPAGYRADEYYMSHLAGTDVWYKTVRIRRGSRFTYMLSPNDRAEDRTVTEQRDPLNPRRQPDEVDASDSSVTSVLELPGAPDESWVRDAPATRGVVEQKTFKSALLKGTREMWIYAPPRYAPSDGPYPLVILFDGRAYIDHTWGVRALNTLDNLINEKRIRPAVVCFVDSSRNRGTDLAFGDVFASAVADELLPMLRSSYAISKASEDVVIGGYSLGGVAASFIALKHPELFGNVLSQSGAFRGRMAGSLEPNSLTQMYLRQKTMPVRFYLDSGLYEPAPNAQLPIHEMVLDETNTAGNRHFRDVLIAKGYDVTYRETGGAHQSLHWRATLADGLMTLLKPTR